MSTIMLSKDPKRILFIRPSALGDVCRSVPVVASLKRAWPNATIDWLVQTEFLASISEHPAVSGTLLFPRHEMRRWYLPTQWMKMFRFLRLLRSKKYDLVIDGQGLGRSGLFAWATRAKIRIGSSSAREFGWLGYTDKVTTTCKHTVGQMLELVRALGVEVVEDMQLFTADEDSVWWANKQEGLPKGKYAVLAPTSRWKSKQWPVERFEKAAPHLLEQGMQSVVVVGAPSEHEQVATIFTDERILNLLPEMTVGRLLAVIEHADVVLANDSAALHIAVGFKRPCVALFGPTDPAVVGPYKQDNAVIAAEIEYSSTHYRDKNISDSTMRLIQVEAVTERLGVILKAGKE